MANVRIRVDFDASADSEGRGNQWRELHRRVEEAAAKCRAKDRDAGVTGKYGKFADRDRHGEPPEPLSS